MLKGKLIIRDVDLGDIEYDLSIRDTFNDTKMFLESKGGFEEYTKCVDYFDLDLDENGNRVNMFKSKCLYENAYVMEKRRLDVKKANKYKSNIINKDMCLKVSSLLRYVQSYKTDSTVIPGTTIRRTEIEGIGFIENNLGLMHRINISNKYCTIIAETVDDSQIVEDNMFSELKAKDKYGNYMSSTPVVNVAFMLCEDYLGFEYVPVAKKEAVNLMGVYETIEEVIENNPDKNTDWILSRKYEIVTDDNLEEVIKEFRDWDGYIAFDTETTGLNINFKSRTNEADQLVGVVLSKQEGTGYYFPLQHKLFKNLCNGDHFYFMEKYMRDILEKKKIICHNTQYDWKVAYIYDINVNVVYDTMIAFQVTKKYEEPTFEVGLKALAKNILGLDMFDLSDFVISGSFKDSNIGFWDLPFELVRRYAPADADMTLSLFNFIESEKIIHKYGARRVFEMEITFAKAASYSEFYGYHIDRTRTPQLMDEIVGNMEKYTQEMYAIAKKEFNPNSSQQLVTIMYDELGIELIEGTRSTSKDKLKALAKMENADGTPKYPFVVALRNYRTNEGIYKNFLKRLDEFATPDGFVFPGVQSLGTTTGRCAVKNPNYQSYNDAVKKFVTPREGFIMFDSDFSQIEYRVLASMAGQTNLMKEFDDPDLDYHQYQASRMFNVPYALVSSALRQQSKGVNFGLPYGMGDGSLGKAIFGEQTKENTIKAGQLRRKFFQGQEKIENFFEVVRTGGVRDGYTSTLFGRRRYYQRGIFSVSAIRRQAGNHVIQGCLDGDTRIQTKEYGIVKIKDVVGLNLNVWDGERWTKGDITYSGKKKKCIVRFSGGMSMVCSPIHKFLTVSHKGNKNFVDCKDLRGSVDHKNAHRVVINQNYEESDYIYSSEDAYKYSSNVHNANNIYLEDTEDRFGLGVVLGRLASDGSYQVREDGGSYLTQFVAEHEYSILPKLKSYMKNLEFVEKEKDLREGRTQKMTQLTAYSKSLVSEVRDLDIKHQVHDNIFMDTEVLRGFLSGFFDGDGGISGKTITLTFGKQFNFEPMCLDLQKALLFFGVRSRYRVYDDRYVLAIKTNDNQRFLDVIGFVNEDKQAKGRGLSCKTDEHTFGRCLMVESVEITDEYIDMYDVCNTERGYYIADGVVTHNTAADIYKMAVIQMFNRIVKEGWLGKVLFNAFVHDELLMEVHQSINMYEFLTMWREEFEVKIENFCRLYSGIGCGFCWYDAKKEDFPPQYLDVVESKYRSNPDMEWDCDLVKFRKELYEEFEAHKHVRIKDYILASENQNEVIKPAINKLLEEMSGKIRKEWESNGLMDAKLLEVPEAKSKGLEANLKVFCNQWGIDYNSINILESMDLEENNKNNSNDLKDDEEDFEVSVSPIDMVKITGVYLDVSNRKLYLINKPFTMDGIPTNTITYLFNKGIFKDSGAYQIRLYDIATNSCMEYDKYISDSDYRGVISPLYSMLNNTVVGVNQL